MERELVNGEAWNNCFGCSPHNDRGLRLVFVRRDDGSVDTRHRVSEQYVGPPGTVHGGIQATVLDEAMGMAANNEPPRKDGPRIVTADFQLRYRRGQCLQQR